MSEKLPRSNESRFNRQEWHAGSPEEERRLSQDISAYAKSLQERGLEADAAKLFDFAEEAAKIEKESRTDELTGLLNRAGFREEWNRYLAFLRREHAKGVQMPSAFLAFDLDDFKRINDTVGHEAGDRFLRLVAERVAPILRETDVFGRLGGDEFSVFLVDSTSEGTVEVARAIRTAIESINGIMREEYEAYRANASASIGVVTIDGMGHIGDDSYTTIEQHPTMEEIKRYADYATYVVKKMGGKGGESTLKEAWELDSDRKIEKAFLNLKNIPRE